MGACASVRPPHEKRFRRAIKLYEVGEVRSLTNLFNRNRCFESGDTPLTLAALEGHEAVVETLLGSGANVNRIDANGRCPLHIAVQQNDDETVDICLGHGANPNLLDATRMTPLSIACEKGYKKMVQKLVAAGADMDGVEGAVAPLVHAVVHGRSDCVEVLLNSGADANVSDARGTPVLQLAVASGDVVTTHLLLALRADAAGRDDHGAGLVCLASLAGAHGSVRALVNAGCGIDGYSVDDDVPPLVAAAVRGSAECIDVLLAAGAHPDTLDRRGHTPLQIAVLGVVDVERGSFYRRYFSNVYRSYARYDPIDVVPENATRVVMSLVQGGADVARVWPAFARLFPPAEDVSYEATVLAEVLVQAYGFDGLAPAILRAFITRLIAIKAYGLLKLLYSAGVDPDWQDTSVLGLYSDNTADRVMFRWVRHLRANPRRLKDLCRRRIRRHLATNVLYHVDRLPLTDDLKDYVVIMDTEHYSNFDGLVDGNS